jgi:hypothetical protein
VPDRVIRWLGTVRSGAIPPPNCGRPGPGHLPRVVKRTAAMLQLGGARKDREEATGVFAFADRRVGVVGRGIVEHLLHDQRSFPGNRGTEGRAREHEENSVQEQKTTHGYLEPRLGFVKGGYNGDCRNYTFEQEVETDGQGSLT